MQGAGRALAVCTHLVVIVRVVAEAVSDQV